MFPHLLLFFQDAGAILDAIKVVGFPVVVALALLWFAYKVWGYTTSQIERKDAYIEKQAEEYNEFCIKIAETQDTIASNFGKLSLVQDDMAKSFSNHTQVLTQIKEVLQTQSFK